MKPLVLIFQTLLGCCLGAMSLAASAQMTPVGLWRNVDDETGQAKAEIRIQMEANGHLTGRVEKILVAAEDNVLCDACQDDRHGQRISGMEIIRGVRRAEQGLWWEGGHILDPDSGKIYKVRLTPLDGGRKLEVRGSWGPFWRTQTWLRIP
jgi:uncharacterized protein (DUF2147 family)